MKFKKNINLISGESPLATENKFKKGFLTFLKFFSLAIFLFILTLVILHWPWVNAKLKFWWKYNRNVADSTLKDQSPSGNEEVISEGERLIISKIEVDAPIIWMESEDEEEIQRYLQNGVGHYPNTAFPGEVGNCVITGHSSNYWWSRGEYNYVFALLDNLVVGDQAIIYYKQKKYVYEISEIKIVSPENIEVLQSTSEPSLTLITCTPPGTNWRRLIVKAKQIQPPPGENITPLHPHLLPFE